MKGNPASAGFFVFKEGPIKAASVPSAAKQAAEKVHPAACAERPGAKALDFCWDFRRAKALRSHRKAQSVHFSAACKAALDRKGLRRD